MNTGRINYELRPIREHLKVSANLHGQAPYIIIHDLPFPDGWAPSCGEILLVLPRNYPQGQPLAFIRTQMRYTKGPAKHWIRTSQAPHPVPGYQDWARWCIEPLDWSPHRHTLHTMLKLVMNGLQQPSRDNPYDRELL